MLKGFMRADSGVASGAVCATHSESWHSEQPVIAQADRRLTIEPCCGFRQANLSDQTSDF